MCNSCCLRLWVETNAASGFLMRNCRRKILNGKQIGCIFLLSRPKHFNQSYLHLYIIHTMLKFKLCVEKGLIGDLSALWVMNPYLPSWHNDMNWIAHFHTPSSFWFTSSCPSSLRRPCGWVCLSFYHCVENTSWKGQRKHPVFMRLNEKSRSWFSA